LAARPCDELGRFATAIERFEDELARATAHPALQPLPFANALRQRAERYLGWTALRARS